MSTLQSRLKLGLVVGALLTAGAVDASRAPEHQLSARAFILAVEGYQHVGRPLIREYVQCRYRPTCSEYGIQAVRVHGIARGLMLTVRRVASCRSSVPLGTNDPVPPR